MAKYRASTMLSAGASLLAFATAAGAQPPQTQQPSQAVAPTGQPTSSTLPTPADQPGGTTAQPLGANEPAAPAANEPAEAASPQDIVVTGSRIIRNGNDSPSPVTVVQTQDVLQLRPGTLADALNILPVFSGSHGTTYNPSTTGSVTAGNGNANQLNLRNLSPIRTLVLLDGNRVPPTTFNNIVDVDIIPQLLVQRVDTVTGGVSAVYGSDAVAGVVNYILDRKFEGVRLQGNSGISQRGDNQKIDLGGAVGRSFFDNRLHVEASYQYIDQKGVPNRSSRSFLNLVGVTGVGTAAAPYVLQTDIRQSNFPFGSVITTAAANTALGFTGGNRGTFNPDGSVRQFVNGQATNSNGLQIGGDGGYFDSTLAGKLRAHQLFGRADFAVTDSISIYGQVSGNHKLNQNFSDPFRLTNATISAAPGNLGNAFLRADYRARLAAAGVATVAISQLGGNDTRLDSRSISDQWIYSGGIEGRFLDNWHFGANYSHGRSALDVTLNRNPDNQRVAAALDAVVNPATGQIVCNITLTNPTAPVAQGCVPYNPFGANGSANQAAYNYMLTSSKYKAITRQDDISGNITGSPFSTWAGPVNVAVSGEYRKLSFIATSSLRPTDLRNCTGLRFNCSPTLSISDFTFAENTKITQKVTEGAIEAEVPLLKDVRFAQAVSINGAARYTRYDTSGSYWTWKLGAEWRVSDALRFRATRSRDIRAPTLYELFAVPGPVPVTNQDLLTGASPTVTSSISGNANLKAEIARTTTAGFVFRPTSNLTFTVDGYIIKVGGAIVTISGLTPSVQNACYASRGSAFECTLQTRPGGFDPTVPANRLAANAVTAWGGTFLNLASISTKGIDAEVNFATRLFGRPASARLIGTYQPHIYFKQTGSATIDQGGAAFGPTGYNPSADVRIAGFLRFQPADRIAVDILERWRSPMHITGDETAIPFIVNNRIKSFATTNLTFTFDVGARTSGTQLIFNVENLFDRDPPIGAYLTNGSRAGLRDGFVIGDDPIGRSFNVGFRAKF